MGEIGVDYVTYRCRFNRQVLVVGEPSHAGVLQGAKTDILLFTARRYFSAVYAGPVFVCVCLLYTSDAADE